MSRGLGRVQLVVLENLRRVRADEPKDGFEPFGWQWLPNLAWDAFGGGRDEYAVTRSQLESTRRALRRLAACGLVDVSYKLDMYGSERRELVARLALSVEERAILHERQRLQAQHLVSLGVDPMRVGRLLTA